MSKPATLAKMRSAIGFPSKIGDRAMPPFVQEMSASLDVNQRITQAPHKRKANASLRSRNAMHCRCAEPGTEPFGRLDDACARILSAADVRARTAVADAVARCPLQLAHADDFEVGIIAFGDGLGSIGVR